MRLLYPRTSRYIRFALIARILGLQRNMLSLCQFLLNGLLKRMVAPARRLKIGLGLALIGRNLYGL